MRSPTPQLRPVNRSDGRIFMWRPCHAFHRFFRALFTTIVGGCQPSHSGPQRTYTRGHNMTAESTQSRKGDGETTALIDAALLPCQVGGIIGVINAGEASVCLLATATPEEILLQALLAYPKEFAAQGRFPSSLEGLDAFIAATKVGQDSDTTYNTSNYNCQGFADALARSLLESGVAKDSRLIHYMANEDVSDDTKVNHAVTEIETVDGKRYLVDAQTHKASPSYELDEDGEIPSDTKEWLLDLSKSSYDGKDADYIEMGSPRDFGDTWDSEMTVKDQSIGLNSDRKQRHNKDWGTVWGANSGLQVVNGAIIKCDMGSTPSVLVSRVVKKGSIENQSACDIMDHEPGVSIRPFGICTVLGSPCVPKTPTPWISPTNAMVR